jgi:DNA-binding MarR family transcriptional regulator
MAHVQFLSETDEAGTRLSDVASSLGTTKQYAGKLAKDLESKRLVSLVIDPRDRRAVLAKPTERGRSFLQDACEIRTELEARFLGRLPAARALAFVDALEELVGLERA